MIKSILQFQKKGVKDLEKIFEDYSADLTKVAEMIQGVTKNVVELGCSMIAEEWEFYDTELRNRRELRKEWEIIRCDQVSRLTSLGEVTYKRTYYKNKKTGERRYLLDDLMGFAPKERMTEDAVARILDEAADSSYHKGGDNVCISGQSVSKESVMNKIHQLRFPELKHTEEKRKVKILYIDADEDHVSLQYLKKKGDIRESDNNTFMPRLVYVYEGVSTENKRHELINVKYFGGGYRGPQGVKKLWKEVYDYISEAYDEDYLEKIYVSGDGAGWIEKGAEIHAKAAFVLDKFHMQKYIIKATSHLKDSTEDARSEIWKAINGRHKKETAEIFDRIMDVTKSESKKETVEASKNYIIGHWKAIMKGVKNRQDNIHCSAEGHVSHVFSDRLSSRPLGWSVIGADKMAHLRVYKMNGEDMIELVRFQRQELPLAAGAEEVISSAKDVLKSERKNREKLGGIADLPWYTIPYPQIKKIAGLRSQIWGL